MELNIIYTRTTWNDAAEAINNNYSRINQEIEKLKLQSGIAGDSSVTSGMIKDGAITNPKIYSRAVTSDKIAYGAIRTEHIALGNITEQHLSLELRNKINDDAGYVWKFDSKNTASQVAETTNQTTTIYTRI